MRVKEGNIFQGTRDLNSSLLFSPFEYGYPESSLIIPTTQSASKDIDAESVCLWLIICSGIFEINCSKDIKVQGIIGPCASLEKVLQIFQLSNFCCNSRTLTVSNFCAERSFVLGHCCWAGKYYCMEVVWPR